MEHLLQDKVHVDAIQHLTIINLLIILIIFGCVSLQLCVLQMQVYLPQELQDLIQCFAVVIVDMYKQSLLMSIQLQRLVNV